VLHWSPMDRQAKIGVIGGSGLYELGLLAEAEPLTIHTPYGPHSPGLRIGRISTTPALFLPRHGTGHTIPPHRVPYRANLWAMHTLGVQRIFSVSAMGGMNPEYRIGDVAVPDQIIDWTKQRTRTFFDGPNVVHTPFVEPFCRQLRSALHSAAEGAGLRCYEGGTVVVFEGPRFSTKAESMFFRDVLKADLLSMTAMPEAILARELGICYATLAVISDLDAFGKETVSASDVNEVMRRSLPALGETIERAVEAVSGMAPCEECLPPEGSPYRRSSSPQPSPGAL